MAKAERVKAPAPPPDEIVITLSEREASVLRAVVGSLPGGGERGDVVYGIWDALIGADVDWKAADSIVAGDFGSVKFRG